MSEINSFLQRVKNISTKLVIDRHSKEIHFLGSYTTRYSTKISAEIDGMMYYAESITEQGAAKIILDQLGEIDAH